MGLLESLEPTPTVSYPLTGHEGSPLPRTTGKVGVLTRPVEVVELVVDPTEVENPVVEGVLVDVVYDPEVLWTGVFTEGRGYQPVNVNRTVLQKQRIIILRGVVP